MTTGVMNLPGVGRFVPDVDFLRFKVLLLDDDKDWLLSTSEELKSRGLREVDAAASTSEANSSISKKRYDAILADVKLGERTADNRSEYQGDDWFLDHIDEMRDAYKATVTAYPGQIRDPKLLEKNDIPIVVKADKEEDDLYDWLQELARRKEALGPEILEKQLPELVRDIVLPGRVKSAELAAEVSRAAEALFQDWVRSRSEPNEAGLWLGGRLRTLDQIAHDVAVGSDVGNKILSMFLRHLRLQVGLAPTPFDEARERLNSTSDE